MAGLRPPASGRVVWRDRRLTTSDVVWPSDDVLLVDTTTGGITMTLPLAANVKGQYFVFKKLVAANTLTIVGAIIL